MAALLGTCSFETTQTSFLTILGATSPTQRSVKNWAPPAAPGRVFPILSSYYDPTRATPPQFLLQPPLAHLSGF